MVRSDMTTSGKPKTHRSAVSDVHESDVEARWWAVSCFGIDGEMPYTRKDILSMGDMFNIEPQLFRQEK